MKFELVDGNVRTYRWRAAVVIRSSFLWNSTLVYIVFFSFIAVTLSNPVPPPLRYLHAFVTSERLEITISRMRYVVNFHENVTALTYRAIWHPCPLGSLCLSDMGTAIRDRMHLGTRLGI